MEHEYIDGYCALCGISKNNIRALSPCRETYKPQDNPKEGDVNDKDLINRILDDVSEECREENFNLTSLQQIRTHSLSAAIGVFGGEVTSISLAGICDTARIFERYILGTQSGEKL